MSFDLEKILESKRAFRRQLAARPIEEKLAMLDALRERALVVRPPNQSVPTPGMMHEHAPPHRMKPKNTE